MGLFSNARNRAVGTRAARRDLKNARQNLEETSDREAAKSGGKPIRDDNANYNKANREVLDAEKKVPFWGRW
ncbi:hypothetical protein ACFWYW_59160 [Nonomuraea sp. NPDC059023]|uniref:hypothetical protein n=1 Tax=unclassified Nonomuraea TaxID=2593643 RepID=UPI0036B79515